jgi:hypothetical protein
MRIVTLIIFLFVDAVAFAQFNDSINYYVNHTSTGIINKTNDGSSYVFNNALKFNIYKKNYSLSTTNSWIYGENQNNKTNNDFTSVFDFNLFKTQRHIYYWGLIIYDKSYSLKINNRLQSGLGVGYYIIDRKNFVLQISDGILYENNDLYDSETGGNPDYQILRNSFRVKFRLVAKEIFILEGSDFLQNSLASKEDYIIKSNTSLSIKLRKWLSFTTAVNYNKLNRTGRENLLINFGLTMDKYF